MNAGFSTIPVIEHESLSVDDYQLNLIEQYIIRLKLFSENKNEQILNDFKFLLDKPIRYKSKAFLKESFSVNRSAESMKA